MKSPQYSHSGRTLLPPEKYLDPVNLRYYVWFTGTVGQAEWLITYSKLLKYHAWPVDVKEYEARLPRSIRALTLSDYPDLIITKADDRCTPLLSVEITEQKAFGTNSQQRMARLWTAAFNGIPSAYIFPIESYQHDKVHTKNRGKIARIEHLLEGLKRNETRERTLLELFLMGLKQGWSEKKLEEICSHTDRKHKNDLRENFLRDYQTFPDEILNARQKRDAGAYLEKYFYRKGGTKHIQGIPPEEIYHRVGDEFYYTYIRPVKETESLLLKGLSKLTIDFEIPALPFKLPSDISLLFKSEGTMHLHEDKGNPHLSFRNLPCAPGTAPSVHGVRNNKEDEIALFFRYVDDCCREAPAGYTTYFRDPLLREGEYWHETTIANSFKEIARFADIKKGSKFQSGDFYSKKLANIIDTQKMEPFLSEKILRDIKNMPAFFQVITNNTRARPLGDPYSGTLAVRDIVYTSKKKLSDLAHRGALLVFIVGNNSQHPFILPEIKRLLKKNGIASSGDPSEDVVRLLKRVSLIDLPKNLRCHLLFSDLIYVTKGPREELVPGIPLLLRASKIDYSDPWGEDLFV